VKSTRTVFRTVVIAGAMIGTPLVALADQAPAKNAPVDKKGGAPSQETPPGNPPIQKDGPKAPPSTPTKNRPVDKPSGSGAGSGSADPGSGSGSGSKRPRASSDRPTGRGFVLA
jgi:hypothetical protein